MGEESSKPKPNCAPAAMERERERESFQQKLTLPSNHSTWSGMALGGTIDVMAQNCLSLDVGWSFQKVRNRQLLLEFVPSHEREYYILEWDGKFAELNEWTTFRHKAYLLWCNLHPPIRCRCCCCFSSPRLYVSVALCTFSPSLAPLFCVSRILVSSIVQLWIRRELGFECHSFLLRWNAGIRQLQKWWMQQQGARRSWLSNRKGVVGFWAAESPLLRLLLLLLLQLALYCCVLQLIVDTD